MQRTGSRMTRNTGPIKTKGIDWKKHDKKIWDKKKDRANRINAKNNAMRAAQDRASQLAAMDLDAPDLPYTNTLPQPTPV